jgi:hypothetical protein
VIFGAADSLANGQAFYADVKGRMAALGRDPDSLKILPAAFVVVGESEAEAQEKRARLDSLVHYDSGIRSLSIMLGHDVSGFDPDGPLPDIPETNASKSGRAHDRARPPGKPHDPRSAARAGSYAGLAFVGTARTIADEMQQWLEERLGRVQRDVPVRARGAVRLHRQSCSRITATRGVPPRLYRHYLARSSWLGATSQPLFRLIRARVHVDIIHPDIGPALAGGALIGLVSGLMWLLHGRVADRTVGTARPRPRLALWFLAG